MTKFFFSSLYLMYSRYIAYLNFINLIGYILQAIVPKYYIEETSIGVGLKKVTVVQ